MLDRVKTRLQSFGYVMKDGDEVILTFSVEKVTNTIKNDCNVSEIPDIAGLDLDYAVKQLQEGDKNTVFATGEGSLTAEQRLNNFLNHLLTYGRDEFSCYRRIRW